MIKEKGIKPKSLHISYIYFEKYYRYYSKDSNYSLLHLHPHSGRLSIPVLQYSRLNIGQILFFVYYFNVHAQSNTFEGWIYFFFFMETAKKAVLGLITGSFLLKKG